MKINRPYSTNITSGPHLERIITAFANAYTDNKLATVEFHAAVVKTTDGVQTTVFEDSFSTEIIGLEYIGASKHHLSIKMHKVINTKYNLVGNQMIFYYNTENQTGFVYNPDMPLEL